ncbi:tail fiber domain-containing protein [Paracoccus sp. SY]|uniref:tail fiber domain-containing protein n=1 Tax=Paracoccus sp. SY TaxID=1330255 RepID=UPI001304D264|nr:tail fiber domain-containing protein [Paracoccus sp. SY]
MFKPLQDSYIADAKAWDTPGRRSQAASEAMADVALQGRLAEGQRTRQAMAMGISPNSGRFLAAQREGGNDIALAKVGAGNLARDRIEAQGEAKMANAINLGSGLGVNPATSMQLSNSAIGSGAQGAMGGYNQQGQLLNQDYQNRMQTWQANQQSQAGLLGGLGAVAGMVNWGSALPAMGAMLSSKDAKTDKTPVGDGAALEAVRSMPIESWTYKPGQGDGGRHVGTYAEDFQSATGTGDGKSIDIASAIGVTMGAIKDLDRRLSEALGGGKAVAA